MNYLIECHEHREPKQLNASRLVPPSLSYFIFNCVFSTTTRLRYQVHDLEEKGQGLLQRDGREAQSSAAAAPLLPPPFLFQTWSDSFPWNRAINALDFITRVSARWLPYKKSRIFCASKHNYSAPAHVNLFCLKMLSKPKTAKITNNFHIYKHQFLTFCHVFLLTLIHTHTLLIFFLIYFRGVYFRVVCIFTP